MTINLSMPKSDQDLRPQITVVGVGGAGGNAVNNMIRANLEGVKFVVCNTDAQALEQFLGERKIQLGVTITRGLGAGSRPDVGRAAAEEALEEILDHISSSHMVFITAGMGGGTGTGAAPVIAQAARDQGILTVGVVTKPFQFEGTQRMQIAEAGIEELQQYVDTLLIIPNQNLFRVANEKTTFADAFKMADDVLHSGVRGVTDLMVMPGLINLDFADIRTVMSEMGKAMMGTGEAEGDKRALDAAEAAISNPLLDDVTMKGARGVLINITGGNDMTLFEVDEAANRIREEVYSDALIIFGSTFDEALSGKMRVSMVATGIDVDESEIPRTEPLGLSGPIPSAIPLRDNKSEPDSARPADQGQALPTTDDDGDASVPSDGGSSEPAATDEPDRDRSEPASSESPAAAVADTPPTEHATEGIAQTEPPSQSSEDSDPSLDPQEPFIPPRPLVAGKSKDGGRLAEPFAAAAIENASPVPQSKRHRGLTLFERLTGAGRTRTEDKSDSDDEAVNSASPSAEPALAAGPVPDATPQSHDPVPHIVSSQEPSETTSSQPALKGLEDAKREPTSLAEEEMLEIPAFLRRQAN